MLVVEPLFVGARAANEATVAMQMSSMNLLVLKKMTLPSLSTIDPSLVLVHIIPSTTYNAPWTGSLRDLEALNPIKSRIREAAFLGSFAPLLQPQLD